MSRFWLNMRRAGSLLGQYMDILFVRKP